MSPRSPEARLGRGLAALIGDHPGGRDEPTRSVDVDLLEPGPFQPRTSLTAETLEALTTSVRASGILQPLLARPHPADKGRFQLIAGERRWRAAQAAGLRAVPVLIRDLNDTEAATAGLVENLQRLDLDPIEEAEGYKNLVHEFDLGQEAVAQMVGKSRSHVANTLRLLNLPKVVQGHLRGGALSAGHARALLTCPDPEKLADTVIARGLNVRQTEALVRRTSENGSPQPSAKERPADPHAVSLGRELSTRLGLRVHIVDRGSRGVVQIHYESADQLEGVISLLGQS